jgi:hypothetical protein
MLSGCRACLDDDAGVGRPILANVTCEAHRAGHTSDRFLFLMTNERRSAVPTHYLAAVHSYQGSWHLWQRAQLDDQSGLPFTWRQRDVSSCSRYLCSYIESFLATIGENVLRHRRAGFDVKVYAASGAALVLGVDSTMVAAQLRVVDSLRTALSPPRRQ